MKDEVQRYNLGTGEHMHNILASVGDIYVSPNGHYIVVVDTEIDKVVKIHDSGSV